MCSRANIFAVALANIFADTLANTNKYAHQGTNRTYRAHSKSD
jgi:hypothetical protein